MLGVLSAFFRRLHLAGVDLFARGGHGRQRGHHPEQFALHRHGSPARLLPARHKAGRTPDALCAGIRTQGIRRDGQATTFSVRNRAMVSAS